MWQVVHPDWYPVLPLFSGICGKSFTQIGTLCYLCFQVYAPGHSPRLVPFVSSPELLGSQGELIVYPCSGVRPSYVVRRPSTISNIFSSETTWPIKAKFYVEPPWEGGTKVYINGPGHMTKMAATPIYGKNPSKIFFSRTSGPIFTKLGM